jgi:hypothetical protein
VTSAVVNVFLTKLVLAAPYRRTIPSEIISYLWVDQSVRKAAVPGATH